MGTSQSLTSEVFLMLIINVICKDYVDNKKMYECIPPYRESLLYKGRIEIYVEAELTGLRKKVHDVLNNSNYVSMVEVIGLASPG